MINLSAYEHDGFAISGPIFDEDDLTVMRGAVDSLHQRALSGNEPDLSDACVFERAQPARKRNGRELAADQDAVFILGDPTRFDPGLLKFTGSHKSSISANEVPANDPCILTAQCAPGAIVAIHPLVLHGGTPNASALQRRNLVLQWGVAECPLMTEARESVTGMTPAEMAAQLSSHQTA